jgi:hypothetical protein
LGRTQDWELRRDRTLKLLQENIWFPGIAKFCKEAVQNWQSCQFTHARTCDDPLQSTPLPPGPWHTISVIFKGPFKDGTYAPSDMIFTAVIRCKPLQIYNVFVCETDP